MPADSHSIMSRWKKYLCQLLSVYVVNDVRPTKIHKAGPLVFKFKSSQTETANKKLKRHKVPDIDQTDQATHNPLHAEIHKLNNSM
jgi:hypothetical protein